MRVRAWLNYFYLRATKTFELVFLELDHTHPEHDSVADVDIVLAHVVELAIGFDPEYRKARGHGANACAVSHQQWHVVRGDQQAPGRVDVKSPAMNAARVDMLNRRRLAARW